MDLIIKELVCSTKVKLQLHRLLCELNDNRRHSYAYFSDVNNGNEKKIVFSRRDEILFFKFARAYAPGFKNKSGGRGKFERM